MLLPFGEPVRGTEPAPAATGPPISAHRLTHWAILAAAYFVVAGLGLALAPAGEVVSPLWLASGVALAALLGRGSWMWPGVALGALLVAAASGNGRASLFIAAGNTLEVLIAARLLGLRGDLNPRLSRLRDVQRLLVLGAGVGPLVAATVGTASLVAFAPSPIRSPCHLWLTWWLGDALGLALGTPLFLPVAVPSALRGVRIRVSREAAALLLAATALSTLLFEGAFHGTPLDESYVLIPLVVAAAMRMGQAGVSLLIVLVSIPMVWGTGRGTGPFAVGTEAERLQMMALYAAALTVVGQVLSAVMAERARAVAELRESGARFRGVFESDMVPMAFWHDDARVTAANDAWLAMLGQSRAELEAGAVRWDGPRPVLPASGDAKAPGRWPLSEEELVRPDGTRVPVLVGSGRLGPDHGIAMLLDLTELKRAERELAEQLRFEWLIAELSASFALSPAKRIEAATPQWLARMGEFLGVERVSSFRAQGPPFELLPAHSWRARSDPADGADVVPTADFCPYLLACAEEGRIGRVGPLDDLSAEAVRDRADLARVGFRAALSIPLLVDGRSVGALLFLSRRDRTWPVPLVQRLQLVGELFAGVSARKAMQGSLRRAESLSDAVLHSLPGVTVVVDREGVVVQQVGARRRGRTDGAGPYPAFVVGGSYQEACRAVAGRRAEGVEEMLHGLERVLAGTAPSFVGTCTLWHDDGGLSCYQVRIERLARREGGAVVVHLDATALRRAELESERHRAELAHVVRVATMGELAASLAHELNQPLTAILSNAQAGRRLLERPAPDLVEIRDILLDIGENDRRAGEILRRMRALLKKGELEVLPVDLNELVRDVSRLVSSDIRLRQVELALELDQNVPRVRGDRIQLQQVVLNFVLNGLEALAASESPERSVRIRTRVGSPGMAELAVSDSGDGIAPATMPHLFEAFYTTKPHGLGMGLSIARTIVEAHGGRIWAANNPGRGATVGFALPAGGDG